MNELLHSRWFPIVLLVCSNVFMTFPANRYGHSSYSATELKIIQEVVTLVVFSGFVFFFLGEKLKWNHFAAFLCILAAVAFTFLPQGFSAKAETATVSDSKTTTDK